MKKAAHIFWHSFSLDMLMMSVLNFRSVFETQFSIAQRRDIFNRFHTIAYHQTR